MTEVHFTRSVRARKPRKPKKPYPGFPLFPHATKRWAKKILGRMEYFGPWDDPDGALERFLAEKDDLYAGRRPNQRTDGFTLADLGNAFLNFKRQLVDAGELTERSWQDYKETCDLIIGHWGKTQLVQDIGPEHFEKLRAKLAKKWGPSTLGNTIQRIRVAFKYAFDSDLIDRPVRYGQGFKRPSKKTLRQDKARKGPNLFTADEIRTLLNGYCLVRSKNHLPGPQLRAMILLGINCGFGNADCGSLPVSALDLDKAIVDFPRPKTGIPRRAVLWPETVLAIREALDSRPDPKKKEHADLVFITKYGHSWAKTTRDNEVSKEIAKLLHELGINGRKGLGFYTLRHTFRTVADETKDQPAVDFVMGHESPHMSSHYRETISTERLRAVSDYVRAWLFAGAKEEKPDVVKFRPGKTA